MYNMYYLKLVKMHFIFCILSELLIIISFSDIKVDGLFQNLLTTIFFLLFLKINGLIRGPRHTYGNSFMQICEIQIELGS